MQREQWRVQSQVYIIRSMESSVLLSRSNAAERRPAGKLRGKAPRESSAGKQSASGTDKWTRKHSTIKTEKDGKYTSIVSRKKHNFVIKSY